MTATIIKSMMSLAAEAELGALFIHAKEAAHICNILTKMGHPQPRTPIQADNSNKDNAYAFPLAMQPQSPRTIQNLLAARENKPCRLLHKALSTGTPG